MIVAVYGTLKGMNQGHFLDHGITELPFHMWSGAFPVVVPTKTWDEFAGRLRVEVYQVSRAEADGLDSYEGYPSLYGREKYLIRLDHSHNGVEYIDAWIYTGNQIKAHLPSRPRVKPDAKDILHWPFHSEREGWKISA